MMVARSRWILLTVAALALGACGGSAPAKGGSTCGPSNCAGCCDAAGKCQLPTDDHCGVDGATCATCASPERCDSAGTCVVPPAGSGSTSGASTSSTTGSSGSSTATTGSSGSSGTSSTTGGSTTGTSTSSSTTSSGTTTSSDCCLVMNCPGGCDPSACACLGTSTTGGTTSGSTSTGGTTGSLDAGAICQTQSCVVYAESARTLYQVDPNPPNSISQICNFGGAIHPDAGVNDIAVTRNGALYGITKNDLFAIDPQTCVGSYVATLVAGHGDYNCLTFTDQDTLLAADGSGQVVTIDITTGDVADAGRFGGGLGCSGDIVALSDGTIYATAKVLNDGGVNDLLVTLDPTRGYAATPVSSNTLGYKGIFGLGYWAGTLYGFDKNGHTLAINPTQGTSTLVHTSTGVTFYGAGTTPLAPIVITH